MTRTQYASVGAKFDALATVEGEHVVWAGPVNGAGLPILSLNRVHHVPTRIAFERHHGRAPVGQVRPSCGRAHCLRGEHLDDAELRDQHCEAMAKVLGIPKWAVRHWRHAFYDADGGHHFLAREAGELSEQQALDLAPRVAVTMRINGRTAVEAAARIMNAVQGEAR